MRILLTNLYLDRYAGTEVYTRDLALALKRRRHSVTVYSPDLGIVAKELRKAGILVTDVIDETIEKPDIIHGQHFVPAMDAVMAFENVPTIYVVHDRLFAGDAPPRHSRFIKYVAVDHNCLDKLTIDNEIPEQNTEVIYNWVDTSRFRLRETWSSTPQKALVFSNYARRHNYYREIKAACDDAHIQCDVLGDAMHRMRSDPESVLAEYDIIFAKAKAAIEAIATGAAVILCDERGLGEMVTMENLERFRRFNFGMRTLSRPVTKQLLLDEIGKYEISQSKSVAESIRVQANLEDTVDQIERLYLDVIDKFANDGPKDQRHDEATVKSYHAAKSELIKERQAGRQLATIVKKRVKQADALLFGGALAERLRSGKAEKLDQGDHPPYD